MAPAAEIPQHTPDIVSLVGNAFVHQYYHILHQSPELVHRFYHEESKLGRPEQNGVMSTTTTMQAINEKIISLEYEGLHADISTVDTQQSYNGGVLVFVTGYLTERDSLKQKFSQTFFLAPQDKGYFVLNDVFRYVGDSEPFNGIQIAVSDAEAPLTPPAPTEDLHSLQENHFTEQSVVSEEVNGEKLNDPSDNVELQTVEQEEPIPEAVDEIPREMPNAPETFVESNIKAEEAPKKSYASILKVMKENVLAVVDLLRYSLERADRYLPRCSTYRANSSTTSVPVFRQDSSHGGNVEYEDLIPRCAFMPLTLAPGIPTTLHLFQNKVLERSM